jgi:alpha-D-xyloside xylohydrolase
MPYLFSEGVIAMERGLPLSLRAMCLEFPDDPTSWYLDRQFMIGSRLLAAPVFDESGEVDFYLPKGNWTSFFTNETRAGPGWFKERHGFGTLPLYVRENTILVLGGINESGPVYDYRRHLEVCLYQVKEGTTTTLVDSNGKTLGELEIGEDCLLKDYSFLGGDASVAPNRALREQPATRITQL